MDAQTSLDDVAALAALVQRLARHEAERARRSASPRRRSRVGFRAAATGWTPRSSTRTRCVRPLREVAARAAVAARAWSPASSRCGDALEGVERLREGGGAARQRAEHARTGMDGLVHDLTRRTVL